MTDSLFPVDFAFFFFRRGNQKIVYKYLYMFSNNDGVHDLNSR